MFGNYFGGFGGFGGMMPSFGQGGGFLGNMYQQPQMMSGGYRPFMGNPFARGFQRSYMPQQQMMYSPYSMGGPMNYTGGGLERLQQTPEQIGETQQQDLMQQRFAEMQKQLAATKERVLPQTYTPPAPSLSSRDAGRPAVMPPSANFRAQPMSRYAPLPAAPMPMRGQAMIGNANPVAPPRQTLPAGLAGFSPGGAQFGQGFLGSRFGAF